MMPDLFGNLVLPGFRTQADIIEAEEERLLIEYINASELTPFRFQEWTGKRLTCSFGWSYDFEAGRPVRAPPLPDWLCPFRDRAACFAKLDPSQLTQALLTRYDPGAGIGWHLDRAIYQDVVGLSLGEPAAMRFRQRRANGFARVSAPLEPRSAYHLSGSARYDWEHSIVAMERTRWSITFRSFAEGRYT